MIIETVVVGAMQVNCYILACGTGKEAIIIDPGDDASKINSVLKKHKLKPTMVINTHGHYDHIGCDDEFGVNVYVHKDDLEMLTDAQKNFSASFSTTAYKVSSEIKTLTDKEIIKLDCMELEVIHLPGHTCGGIGLLMKAPQTGIIFTGDTLFCQGVGRYDLPNSSRRLLENSLKKLFALAANTKVYPGHGEPTFIGREKENNVLGI